MGISKDMHQRVAKDGGDVADETGGAAQLRTEGVGGGLVGRAVEPEDEESLVEDSADHARWIEGGDSGTAGSMIGSGLDDLRVALRAHVSNTLSRVTDSPPMLGRYVVLGTLGEGGMGTVLEAFDHTLDRKVAIKVLHEELSDEHTARLLREARAMAKLSHPSVVQVFEADTMDGQTFVVMELVAGRTLRDWMDQEPSPDWRQCVAVLIEAGQGLAAAHAESLVHRDFKPSNAIIDDKGRTRVLDFGLARRTEIGPTLDEVPGPEGSQTHDDSSLGTFAPERASSGTVWARDDDPPAFDRSLTETGAVMGTPAYMSPEQMMGREANARSDQFSFCVTLYEAVYGERPFEGGTLMEIASSMKTSGVRPAPQGSPVPARLRRLLLRGLAADPGQRWPSMEALLHELRMLVAPRTRGWMAVGVASGLAAVGGGLALGQYAQVKDRCTGAPAHIVGIWDDGRRGQVRAAILGTEVSFAAGTWERIEPQLDAYARDWTYTHTEACEATSVRGEQSEEALDLRMRCLGQRRTALRATVDVLVDADAEVVRNAVELVASLPTLARCNDLAWLELQDRLVPLPEDPDLAVAVQTQRACLAEIEVMDKAGRYAEALDAVESVVEQAEALGYPPLRAEALYWWGELRRGNGQYVEAEEGLRQAHALAVEYYHDPVVLDTAQALTVVVGNHLARYTEGHRWGETVALPLARRSGEPRQEARSLNNLGAVFRLQGDYDEARAHFERALGMLDKALGPDHPEVATSLSNLGIVFVRQGDYDQARAHFERALATREKALGPDHPGVAHSLGNLGLVLESQGDYDEARAHFERALGILDKALGPDHPGVAHGLSNLGTVFNGQGDYERARAHFERALGILDKALGPDHPDVAKSLVNVGSVFESLGDYEQARAHFERALAIFEKVSGPEHPDLARSMMYLGIVLDSQGEPEKARVHYLRALAIFEKALGPDHPQVARGLMNLGLVFKGEGDDETARVHYLRALSIFEKALGPDHPDVAYSLVALAKLALDTGDPASARAYAERAVSVREAVPMSPALLARARLVLARALWPTQSERARARTLAEKAREVLAAAEGSGGSNGDLAEVESWLATHRIE